ncbi:hypothetical protein CI15_06445 [Paraburkholderia monticola]|uniref:Uncharacterized protein n=1 Tax=Paraburkholderia monticola TaxID=1399968 RepID=A0A149PXK9_9BURK|nr:hypothetical protein CI15_06445 [Paraburkholderia monticola]
MTPDYHLPPYFDFGRPRIRLADQNFIEFESHRLDSQDVHYGVVQRHPDLMVEFESITTTISLDQPQLSALSQRLVPNAVPGQEHSEELAPVDVSWR